MQVGDGLPELRQVECLIGRSQRLRADQLAGLRPSSKQLASGGVRIAERELFLKEQIAKAKAAGQFDEIEPLEIQLSRELRRLNEECEAKKEKVRTQSASARSAIRFTSATGSGSSDGASGRRFDKCANANSTCHFIGATASGRYTVNCTFSSVYSGLCVSVPELEATADAEGGDNNIPVDCSGASLTT